MPNTANDNIQSIAQIISSVLTSQVVISYQSVTNNYTVTQIARGNCSNTASLDINNVYIADTRIFTDQSTYQKAVNTISQQIVESIAQTSEGGIFSKGNQSNVEDIINSLVTTNMTAAQMDVNSQSNTKNFALRQVCQDSGTNCYVGTEKDLTVMYNNTYANNSATQDTATAIANYLESQTEQKTVGAFTALIRSIAALIIFAIVLIVVIVVILTLTYGRVVT